MMTLRGLFGVRGVRGAAGLAAAAGLLLAAGPVMAQPVQDKEKLIDVASLEEAMNRATTPLAQRVEASKLGEAFAGVNELLRSSSVDKTQLITALRTLSDEIGRFTENWDAEVAGPMWDAQDAVGGTIGKIRSLLAKGDPQQVDRETQAKLDGYDRRLETLALQIQNETDPMRAERMRLIFANIRSLRDIVQATGSFNLGSAREALYVKTIRALAALEAQLTNAMFEIERVRLILSAEGEFITEYVDLLEGLVEAQTLARMLSASGEGSELGIGSLVDQIGQLSLKSDELGFEMDLFVEELAENIEIQTEQIADDVQVRRLGGINVDDEVSRYADQARAKRAADAAKQTPGRPGPAATPAPAPATRPR